MKSKISITKKTEPQKYNASITIKHQLVPGFLDILGTQMLQGVRTEMPDGYVRFEFNADNEAVRILKDMFNMLAGFTITEN